MRQTSIASVTGTLLLLSLPSGAIAQDTGIYPSPTDAVRSLARALSEADPTAVAKALGPDAEELVADPDDGIETEDLVHLYREYRSGYRFVPQENGMLVLEIGDDFWPFPIPLEEVEGGWAFNLEEGAEEIALREIGRNELDVIDVLNAYHAVQAEFRMTDHDGDGVMEFAASLVSPEGARTGLYWDGDDSPIGDLAARASMDGHVTDAAPDDPDHEPFHGYFFRVLTEQGDNAPGGAMSYIVNGNMVAGHALLAAPAEYGVTGVTTFLVAENGEIWEADLGDATLDTAFEIISYDPDASMGWERLQE